MPKKQTPKQSNEKRNTSLVVSRNEAEKKIKNQIDKGIELKDRTIQSETNFEEAKAERQRWRDYTYELLSRLFDDDSIAEQFARVGFRGLAIGRVPNLYREVEEYRDRINDYVNELKSIYERLELIPENLPVVVEVPIPQAPQAYTQKVNTDYSKVFIVHGHDNEAKLDVARFVEKIGLEAIIFHEQEDLGQTIIEKLERVSDVGYAIVLLTPDDVGRPVKAAPEEEKNRARQNVIFEWGYFISKLSRKNVIALLKDDVEVLSDMQGVLWTRMDPEEGWKYKLVKEMKAAGMEVDITKLF